MFIKIIAKKGSALEQTIKDMCDRIASTIIGAHDLVEQIAVVRPTTVYFLCNWDSILRMIAQFGFNNEDEPKINPHLLRKKKGEKNVWVPSKRYKEGRALAAAFGEYARVHEIDEEPLHQYGIHATYDENGQPLFCQPWHDKDTNRYQLICYDSILMGFDKEKLAQDQFEVEYSRQGGLNDD